METDYLALLWGKKAAELCEKTILFSLRFPKLLPNFFLKEIGSFFSSCSDEFLEKRPLKILRRALFFFFRALFHPLQNPGQRIELDVFYLDASSYGLMISLRFLKEQESFGEEQIQKGLQNLIPGIRMVKGSFLSWEKKQAAIFYIEARKVRGGPFLKEEREKIIFDLPFELLQRIELVSQSLFLPGNEEELFKNVRHLAGEIRYVNDFPQVMISFVEYLNENLKFLVICLRVIKDETSSIIEQSSFLPSLVRFSLENLFVVEKLRKRYPKEAAIFTLEVGSSLFLRNKNSVNLRAARQYISKALEQMLGSFRDYNGGLLVEENRQLIEIKQTLERRGVFFYGVEDFFYRIKPVSLRATFSPEIALQLIEMIQKMAACPLLDGKKYHLEFYIGQKAHLVVIQTSEKGWKTTLPKQVLSISSQIGSSSTEDDRYLYLCFFHLNPTQPLMLNSVLNALTKSSYLSKDLEKGVLRFNFQGGDPASINPRFAADIHSNVLARMLFEGLTRFSSSGEVELAACHKVEISDCQTRYTFHLRSAWWSCGEELTAYDFERSWKKALSSHSAACMRPEFFFVIKNAKKASEKKCPLSDVGIFSEGAKTLVVELEKSCPYFLNLLATPSFFPLYGEDEEPTVFNGPFILAEWKQGVHIVLSQNPFYWNARYTKLSGVKISLIKDSSAAYELFLRKSLDVIGDPISPLSPKLLRFLDGSLKKKTISRVFWIHCNLRKHPLKNENLRRALSLAIDRKKLVEKVFIGQSPHASLLPLRYAKHFLPDRGDVCFAQEFYKKALEELGEIPPLKMIHSNLSFEKPLSEELILQWKEKLGVTVESTFLPWTEFSFALENGDFDLGGLFRRDLFNNPAFYLQFFNKSADNIHSWEDKEYEALISSLEEKGAGDEIVSQIEELFLRKAPAIGLVNQTNLMLTSDRIQGFEVGIDGGIDLKNVRISNEKAKNFTFDLDFDSRVSDS